jgi:enoyl-CoA hydratase
MGGPPPGPIEALTRRRNTDVVFDAYHSLRTAAVPILGVVRGRAAGFGCALAALCDITIADADATFQIPEMTHSIMPTMVMSALIDRVPAKAMAYLVYTASVIDAPAALGFGIVSAVAPAGGLDAAVAQAEAALAHAPGAATAGIKDYLRTARDMSLQGSIDYARNLHATVNSSSEMRRAKGGA